MLKKIKLRDQVREIILERVMNGSYQPGKKVVLSKIANDLDVSATPIREALTQLEHEGLLMVEPNRGFYITPLHIEDAQQLYPLIWTLEQLAIKLTGKFSEHHVKALTDINKRFEVQKNRPDEAVAYDHQWHRILISKCGNELLKDKLKELKRRSLLYEYYYMKDAGRIPTSTEDHTQITKQLKKGDIKGAALMLEKHWKTSLSFLSAWLNSNDED